MITAVPAASKAPAIPSPTAENQPCNWIQQMREYYLNKNDIPNNTMDEINNPISHNSSLL